MTDIITAMRTRYYVFLAAAVLLAGCHKEMEENVPTKMEGKTYLTVSTAQTAIDPARDPF